MFQTSIHRQKALLLVVPLLLLLLLAQAQTALAGFSLCRSDPVVLLSDGRVVTLYADINANLTDIAAIEYSLHAPAGVSVLSVTHPIAATAALEHFTFFNDADSDSLQATTLVDLSSDAASKVTAYMDVEPPGSGKIQSSKKNAESGELITTSVKAKK